MDLLRTVILGAVQRDQHVATQPAEHGGRRRSSSCARSAEYRMQQRRRGRVEHVADVVVGGDFGDAEQALAVRAAVAFLKCR